MACVVIRLGRVAGGNLEVPARQQEVGILEGSTVSHVRAAIGLPELWPRISVAQLLGGDLEERVARDDFMLPNVASLRVELPKPIREREPPARLDERRVRERLPVVHHDAEVEVEDQVGDLDGRGVVTSAQPGSDSVDGLTSLHQVSSRR